MNLDTALYLIVLGIYVARSVALTNVVLGSPRVWAALRVCYQHRKLHWIDLLTVMQPFDLRLLLTGVSFIGAGIAFGAAVFITLDVGFVMRFSSVPGDIAVLIAWSFWAVGSAFLAAAFAERPKAVYRGAGIIMTGLLLIGGLTGRFG